MAEQQGPSKNDIQTILKRLRSQGPNKVCFDCCAKNPTWATVTYGVFICIDCSAVHRSLGVHLTFVRSTQLDTNWTWLQLRQMQLGGNSNAQTFFQQHNCTTNDANQKYNSRAAQLYREKLHNAAVQAMKIHGTKPIIEATNETQAEETKKEVDFFEEHEKFQLADDNLLVLADTPPINSIAPQTSVSSGASSLSSGQPSVAGILSPSAVPEAQGEIKHIIGNRKPMAKKSGLGAKKGLGAQRVKTNFSEIEQRAAMADLMKETAAQEAKLQAERTAEEEEKQIASMRLAYQDLSIAQKKEEDKLRTTDPKKATQIERLGMGFASRSGVSHSAMSDMETIDQDAPVKTSLAMSRRGKSLYDREEDDDFPYGSGFGSFKSEAKSMDVLVTLIREEEWDDEWDRDAEVNRERNRDRDRDRRYNDLDPDMITLEQIERKEKEKSRTGWNSDRAVSGTKSFDSTPAGNEAQKKFGGAKAISSDQFFADSDANSWERKANLSRFEGSTSISSADYFGNGSSNVGSQSGYSQMSAPDLEDMRESVRQGVTKVAGKLSSLANGVMSSFQDRYGGF